MLCRPVSAVSARKLNDVAKKRVNPTNIGWSKCAETCHAVHPAHRLSVSHCSGSNNSGTLTIRNRVRAVRVEFIDAHVVGIHELAIWPCSARLRMSRSRTVSTSTAVAMSVVLHSVASASRA